MYWKDQPAGTLFSKPTKLGGACHTVLVLGCVIALVVHPGSESDPLVGNWRQCVGGAVGCRPSLDWTGPSLQARYNLEPGRHSP